MTTHDASSWRAHTVSTDGQAQRDTPWWCGQLASLPVLAADSVSIRCVRRTRMQVTSPVTTWCGALALLGVLVPCLDCGTPCRTTRCDTCRRAGYRRRDAVRGNASQRGYGQAHRAARAALVAAYDPSDPCPFCGQPLGPDPSVLDAHHSTPLRDDPTALPDVLAHARGNRGESVCAPLTA